MLNKFFERLTYKPDIIYSHSAAISDVGQKRDHNEDSFLIDEQLGLFVVADGMGGHAAGEVASKLAVTTMVKHLQQFKQRFQQIKAATDDSSETIIRSILQDAIEDANNQTHCYNIARGLSEGRGMGTTLTGFLISSLNESAKKKLYSFNVGDSRTYSFHHNKLRQLSTDHSHYQLWLETGKEGLAPRHNIIYKAIGPWQRIVAEQHTFAIHQSELFLLCSDGLCDMINDKQIQSILKKTSKNTLREKSQALINAANDAGGKDNITVMLVKP